MSKKKVHYMPGNRQCYVACMKLAAFCEETHEYTKVTCGNCKRTKAYKEKK